MSFETRYFTLHPQMCTERFCVCNGTDHGKTGKLLGFDVNIYEIIHIFELRL